MKNISFFIISSAELEEERGEIVDFLEDLRQAEYKAKGFYLKAELWEYTDSSVRVERKEDQYLKQLRQCEYCIVLVWNTLGKYSVEELDVAVAEMQAGRKPYQVHVFFKEPAKDITDELSYFKTHFVEDYLGIPKYSYSNIEELRAKIAEIIKCCIFNEYLSTTTH